MAKTLKYLFVLAFVVLCSFTFPGANGDTKLVLIGIVMNDANEAVKNATVELEDVATAKIRQFRTNADGNFYFKLEADKTYLLQLLDESGTVMTEQTVSTVNQNGSDIIHAMLRSSKMVPSLASEGFSIKQSNVYGNSVK